MPSEHVLATAAAALGVWLTTCVCAPACAGMGARVCVRVCTQRGAGGAHAFGSEGTLRSHPRPSSQLPRLASGWKRWSRGGEDGLPPSATSLPSRISGTGGRDAAELGRAAMFPGAPAARPSPTAAADPTRRGPGCPSGGDPGAHRRSRSPAAPSWGSGLERARPARDPRPARTCNSLSVLVICSTRPAGDPAPGCLAFSGYRDCRPRLCAGGSPAGRRAAILSPWLLSRLGVGGERLAPSPRRPPSSEVASGETVPRDTPTPLSRSALWGAHPRPGSEDPEGVWQP